MAEGEEEVGEGLGVWEEEVGAEEKVGKGGGRGGGGGRRKREE